MNKKIILLSALLWLTAFSKGQSVLDAYIQMALLSSPSLEQERLILDRLKLETKNAQQFSFPKIALIGDYFLAGGGRTVDFPAGDLLNPVYNTLNQITNTTAFPTLENERILLNPNNFYDFKLRTTLPVLNKDIQLNKRIKKDQSSLQEYQISIQQRDLILSIKKAYFQFLQAAEAVKIYESALQIVLEGKRINSSLFQNDMASYTALARADHEVTKITTQLENAYQIKRNAHAVFNYLLSRDLESPILADTSFTESNFMLLPSINTHHREELYQMEVLTKINTHLIDMSRSYLTPKLNLFMDVGSQGFDWQFNNRNLYYFMGVNFQWDIYSAGIQKRKAQQALIDQTIQSKKKEDITLQLSLQNNNDLNNYQIALNSYQSAKSTKSFSTQYYKDTLKLYKEGKALYIELLEAQELLLQSQIQTNIAFYDICIKLAAVERSTASYPLKKH